MATKAVGVAILVAALGYFVDIYDLILFTIVRDKSLAAIGVLPKDIGDVGTFLMSVQMGGMLIGGIIWGVMGDRKGRLSVLFGSILLYSIANIANAYVTSVPVYALLRLIAGIGLAGELGAGITLVSESMHRSKRGYGTTIIASVGVLGAVGAWFVGSRFGWQNAYIVGGVMGILLLFLRLGVFESGMYRSLLDKGTSRGNFFLLFTGRARFVRYLRCILIGVPLWYVVGILIFNASKFSAAIGITPPVDGGTAMMFTYVGLAAGDLASGLLSQFLKSRKKVVLVFVVMTAAFVCLYLMGAAPSTSAFYGLCVALGFGSGYWAMFVTIASEQFGTNIRATATTTVPNFVRGTVLLLNLAFVPLRDSVGIINAGAILGVAVISIALVMLAGMEETFGKDLDYIEGIS